MGVGHEVYCRTSPFVKHRLRAIRSHLRPIWRPVRRWSAYLLRHGSYLAIGVSVLLGAIFLAAYLLLPRLVEQKTEIESFLSQKTGFQIRIGKLDTFWDGINPGVHALGVAVYTENATQPALKFDDVRVSLSTLPLIIGRLRLATLTIATPRLAIERDRDGNFVVGGLKTAMGGGADAGPALLAWLGQEGHVEIQDGELQFFDHADPTRGLYVRDVDIQLTNRGDHHYLSIQAELPREICESCSLVADVRGDFSSLASFHGEIYAHTESLNIDALPRVAREHLPPDLKGRVTSELWTTWVAGGLTAAKGAIAMSDAVIPIPDYPALHLRQATANLNLARDTDRLQLALNRALVQSGEIIWPLGTLRYDQRGSARTLQVAQISLTAITDILKRHPIDKDVAREWLAFSPVGAVQDIRLRLDGPLEQPTDLSFRGELANVGVRAHDDLPGVSGLSGSLTFKRDTGTFEIDSRQLVINLPRVFRDVLPPMRVDTVVTWQRQPDHLAIQTNSFSVKGSDLQAKGRFQLRVPTKDGSSTIDLQASVKDFNAESLRRYLPAHILEPGTVQWADSSFRGGHVANAELILHGPLAEFPFDQGNGRFEVRGHVVDASYEFLTGWLPLRHAEADVSVRGRAISVTGRGQIGELKAEHITVQTATRQAASGKSEQFIEVSAEASGPVEETVRILHAVKVEDVRSSWKKDLPVDLEGGGQGWLGMHVHVPIESTDKTTFEGTYRFRQARLALGNLGLAVTGLNGSVEFNRDGAQTGRLRGTAFEGPIDARITPKPDGVVLEIESTSKGSGIASWLGEQYRDRIGGELAWRFWSNLRKGWDSARMEAPTLKTLSLRLPAPLAYEKGLPDTRATLRLIRQRSGDTEWIARAGSLVSARLLTFNAGGRSILKKGEISVGGAPAVLPDRGGLELAARGEVLELDGWIALLAGGTTTAQGGGLTAVRGQFRSARFMGRDFGSLAAGLYRRKNVWSGRLAGERLSGDFRFDQQNSTPRVKLDLLSLRIPKAPTTSKKVKSTSTDPRRLPIVLIQAKSFVYEDADYGALDFDARPEATGWKVVRLKLTRPEADGMLTGSWRVIDGRQRSQIHFDMDSRDAAATSRATNTRGLVGSGTMKGNIDLNWSGGFGDFEMARANGRMKVTAKDGSLSDVKEGAVRVFGALDISSLLKYMTLDFKPLVQEGFLYKTLKFTATVENGNVYTSDFAIDGTSADIKASGRVGVAAEDLDLVVEVSPHIGTGAALAGWWFFGPQAGAIALAIQQLFKRTGTGVHVVYQIKGPWDKPEITRVVESKDKAVEQPVKAAPTPETGE